MIEIHKHTYSRQSRTDVVITITDDQNTTISYVEIKVPKDEKITVRGFATDAIKVESAD